MFAPTMEDMERNIDNWENEIQKYNMYINVKNNNNENRRGTGGRAIVN